MSGSFNELDVPPTLVSFALAMTKAKPYHLGGFPAARVRRVVCLPIPTDPDTMLPDWDARLRSVLRKRYAALVPTIRDGRIRVGFVSCGRAAWPPGVARMAFGNRIGFAFCRFS